MSRRKQRYPSHIAGDGVECQEVPHVNGEIEGEAEDYEDEVYDKNKTRQCILSSSRDSTELDLCEPPPSPVTLFRCSPDPMTSVISTNDPTRPINSISTGGSNYHGSASLNFVCGNGGLLDAVPQNSDVPLLIPKLEVTSEVSLYADSKLVKIDNIAQLSCISTDRVKNQPHFYAQPSGIISSCNTVPSAKHIPTTCVMNSVHPQSFSQGGNTISPLLYTIANGGHNATIGNVKNSFLVSRTSAENVQPMCYAVAGSLTSLDLSTNVSLANDKIFPGVKTMNGVPNGIFAHNINSEVSETNGQFSESENRSKVTKSEGSAPFVCPVCQQNFKSKRSFNSHILVHCQLVKTPTTGTKRGVGDVGLELPSKKTTCEQLPQDQTEVSPALVNGGKGNLESTLPLDLSFKKLEQNPTSPMGGTTFSFSTFGKSKNCPRNLHEDISSPLSSSVSDTNSISPSVLCMDIGQPGDQNHSILSERSPHEDENENLVNEAREREKAFFDSLHNEHFLTDDSTGLDPPPPLPMVKSGATSRKIKVCSDDGPSMVYKIKFHAEQIFVSRILGINEETGDKIELYKCFLCSCAYPSVSRLQAHLCHHKQRFVCRKCMFSCDSRIQFSQHVQKEHVTIETSKEVDNHPSGDHSDDTSNAENTVTVAALLSALHGGSLSRNGSLAEEQEDGFKGTAQREEDDERRSEESFPASPSSEPQMEMGDAMDLSGSGGDLFKMFSCRFCGKKFDRAFSCNRHERVHTGYKPCFCKICGRGFSEPRNLRHHVIRFHSDGSLRHLIKRDRRKKKEEDTPLGVECSPKDVLRECGNKESSKPLLENILVSSRSQEYSLASHTPSLVITKNTHNGYPLQDLPNGVPRSDDLNTYTTNLTKIFAATLDSSRSRSAEVEHNDSKPLIATIHGKDSLPSAMTTECEGSDHKDHLEPGEIRLSMKTKVIDDGERGRRLVIAEDQSEEGLDHSPHFSSYAPSNPDTKFRRLNIVQEPVKRDKALIPITDDIGRTFYECPYCLKFFGSTSDLNRHLDFHEDLRPYECKYCEYSARTNSQLKVHKMRHEGIKQFSCDVCNYNGVTQSDLNRHKKTQSHIARSQNVCNVCGLGFYSTSQKQVHITKCHPEMEGASSLIQMSLGLPPSQDLSTFLGSSFGSSPMSTLPSSADNFVESPPSVNPTTPFSPNGGFLSQLPTDSGGGQSSSSEVGPLEIDMSEG